MPSISSPMSRSSSSIQDQDADVFIGISIGSENSCVSVVKDSKYMVIANEDGDRIIPAYITYYPEDTVCFILVHWCIASWDSLSKDSLLLVGTQSKLQSVSGFRSTIKQFTYLIGTDSESDIVSSRSQKVSVPIDEDKFAVPLDGDTKHVSFAEATTTFLSTLLKTSLSFIPNVSSDTTNTSTVPSKVGAILSYPPSFTDKQVEALRDAALEAGFVKCFLIKSPIAAAFAFHNTNKDSSNTEQQEQQQAKPHTTTSLVIDLGAHSLTVSLVTCSNSIYVLHDHNQTNIGGSDFDKTLANYLKKQFEQKTRCEIDNKRSMLKLLKSAEITKRSLSARETAPCSVESLYDGMDFNTSVNRLRFEMECEPLYTQIREFLSDIQTRYTTSWPNVDEILLTGGASRMPKFQETIRKVFAGIPLRTDVEPDEADTIGCALQAGILMSTSVYDYETSITDQEVRKALSLSKSIGFLDYEGKVQVLLQKGTVCPARIVFHVIPKENQASLRVQLVELSFDEKQEPTTFGDVVFVLTQSEEKSAPVEVIFSVDKRAKCTLTLRETCKNGEEKVVHF